MIIDTHAHLYSEEYIKDLHTVVENAKLNNVQKVLLPNIDLASIKRLNEIVEKFPAFFYPMMGLHPSSVDLNYKNQLETVYEELNSNSKIIAVGEIGIDLYWDKTFFKEQKNAFEMQLKWSIEKQLPVSIHSRSSYVEVLESIQRVGREKLRGVFHSFSGEANDLEALLKCENFYFGINGIVTFKNSSLSKILKKCPLERIVLETDSPFLAPSPYRGKRNEPKFLNFIIYSLSEIFNLKPDEIIHITKSNTLELFDLKD